MMNRRSLLKALGLGAAGSTFLGFKTGLEMKDSLEYKGWKIFWTGWKRNIELDRVRPEALHAADSIVYLDDTLVGQWVALPKLKGKRSVDIEDRKNLEGKDYVHVTGDFGYYVSLPGGHGTFRVGGNFDITPLHREPKFTIASPVAALDKAKRSGFARLIRLLDANV
jgi:hypothetical protein